MSCIQSPDMVENPPLEEFQELDIFLETQDLWRKSIPRDQNSLFRCISEHVYQNQGLYMRVKNYYSKFLYNNVNNTKFLLTNTEVTPSNSEKINFNALSTLFGLNFHIFQHDLKSASNFQFSPSHISLIQTEDNHFDLIYKRSHRQILAFIQSIVYSILYKNVFQIDIPYSKKDFTMQSLRETYFLKQDVYEFSHLERCFNSFYYEDIFMRIWKHKNNNSSFPVCHKDNFLSYSIGDMVKVFSPNTDNKPFYLAKIIKLNVTPGMHEVLAPNRGTELVDIGHLKPTSEENNQYDDSSVNYSISNDSNGLVNTTISSNSCSIPKILTTNIAQNNFTSTNRIPTPKNDHSNSNLGNISNLNQERLRNEVPPGFEEHSIIPTSSSSLIDNNSLVFSSIDEQFEEMSIKAPKHKYGPQSAAVKQKFTHELPLDSKGTLGLKPFEQISENAHSQIKKLQFKLNSSSNFLSPKFSIHPEGSDLPEEKFILQYFYNLGVQYQLMRSHGSNWKDVLPNSCPPLYHDNNYQSTNPIIPLLFRDSAGVYFSQDVLLPNYYYDMTMLPFIQGYLPSMPYGMQGEPMLVQNYGKIKDETDIGKSPQFGDFHAPPNTSSEHEVAVKSTLQFKNKIDNDPYYSKSGILDNSNITNIQGYCPKNPQDNPQTDPNSWPQPGGEKSLDNISWIQNINDAQRPAYSNALKKGTSTKQPAYTAERTIYASSMSNSPFSKTNSKPIPSCSDSNTIASYPK